LILNITTNRQKKSNGMLCAL